MVRCLALLLILTVFAGAQDTERAGAIAIIVKAEGSVRFTALDSDRSKPARRGQIVFPGEKIETAEESFCALKFLDDGSLVRLTANGELIIDGVRHKATIRKRLRLLKGDLYCKVMHSNNTFQVETKSAVATVKGTEFWLLHEEDNEALKLLCLSGLVELENTVGKVLVRRGQTGEVNSGDRQAVVRLMRSGELPLEIRRRKSVKTLDVGFVNAEGERKVLRIQFQE